MDAINNAKAVPKEQQPADIIETGIEQLSLQVRLFSEHTKRKQGLDQLTEREIVLLEFLENKGEASFSELAGFFKKVSPSTVSNMLKKLHSKKLVSRREAPDDLRSTIFGLTAKGRHFMEPIRQEKAELSRIIFESLQLTPEEINSTIKVIERAIKNFDFWLGLSDTPGEADEQDAGRITKILYRENCNIRQTVDCRDSLFNN